MLNCLTPTCVLHLYAGVAGKTSIEWTERSWNPVRGCTHVSPGCKNCYAERQAIRKSGPGQAYEGLVQLTRRGPKWTGKIAFVESVLNAPKSWRQPCKIFVNSMSDLFHEGVTDEQIQRIAEVMRECPQHVFQVLTKRPERFAKISIDWPPNLWLGVSVESRKYIGRIDLLRATKATVKWVSVEPLIGPLGQVDWSGIHWVVVGGESGPRSRPMEADWAREVRDQCVAARVPYFFKQWGGRKKKQAGRVLDGRTWDEYPAPAHLPEVLQAIDWLQRVLVRDLGRIASYATYEVSEDWPSDIALRFWLHEADEYDLDGAGRRVPPSRKAAKSTHPSVLKEIETLKATLLHERSRIASLASELVKLRNPYHLERVHHEVLEAVSQLRRLTENTATAELLGLDPPLPERELNRKQDQPIPPQPTRLQPETDTVDQLQPTPPQPETESVTEPAPRAVQPLPPLEGPAKRADWDRLRAAVEAALRDPLYSTRSATVIAAQLGCSHVYVARVRRELGLADGKRLGADGKMRAAQWRPKPR